MKHLLKYSALMVLALLTFLVSCKHEIPGSIIDPTPIPGPPPNNGICFESEVLPLFQSNCAKSGCHDAITREEGYQLDGFSNIVRKGLISGNANASKIYRSLTGNGVDMMPPSGNTPLTNAQIALIGQWINEGAKNTVNCGTTCDSSQFTYNTNIKPMMQTHCTGCHGGTGASGAGILLDSYATVKAQVTNGKLYPSITHTGAYPMPKGSAKLSDCNIAQVRKWITAGALNN
jgi:mono/diheme cytochrome c family protein